ncbi:MFS transporter [Amycolatopsis sp. PS_44_ISF1]|uniref:MFS transporter n=1 Tax=Amycolatopsis sp. PS_44_ISF1 TaxID=2974917 RepID=UPI0028DF60E9|nr:MFS transporter [Amycolatopsis sp. PS_44_ISF1]MDT8911159.1 MFS transporter [Amycolatopsis sp. PS_44_ISF1]
MALFGSRSDPDGPSSGRPGQGRGRKSKRRWTPEPGSTPARSWREAPPPAANPQPTRVEHPVEPPRARPGPHTAEPPRAQPYPAESPPARPRPYPAEPPRARPEPAPARLRPEPAPRAEHRPPERPRSAEDAPRSSRFYDDAAPHEPGGRRPPPRVARPYPSPEQRTEPVRPRGYQDRPRSDEYEHYDTGGYAGEPRIDPDADRDLRTAAVPGAGSIPKLPKKLTVTRVAALRGRQLSGRAIGLFQRATKADGADKSGLTALMYAVMLNYASDAAMAIALANTLFFAATSGESKGKVALYLLITIAPFALVAPVIGPALDKIQHGRRFAMGVASIGQGLMAVVMALHFDDWLLYPAALGMMVLSKSFTVLKAAITPRVVPPEITLSKTNARITVFGLAAAGVFGALASGVNSIWGSAGALWFTAAICVAAAVQSMRIPSWVEVTEGEVPTSLSAKPEPKQRRQRQPMGRHIVVALWANGSVRVLTGFLMMFAAFAVKEQTEGTGHSPFTQLLLLGIIGAAAGAGGFVGNALGSRLHFGSPDQVVVLCVAACVVTTLVATLLPGLATAAVVGLVGATASALAKISLDAVIQEDLPEQSRASAFGRSETVLQLAWCFGGAVGLLLPPTYWIGFLVVTVLLAVGLTQTYLVRRGSSLVPGLGGDRPLRPEPTGSFPAQGTAGTRR